MHARIKVHARTNAARTLLLVIAAAAAAAPALADEAPDLGAADPGAPTVGASLDRTEAHVGDRLTLTVSAIAHDAVADTVRLPEQVDLGKFELLDSSRADRDLGDGKKSRRFVLQIAAYETGELEIPPIVVEYRSGGETRTVRTTSIPVEVKPVVDDPKANLQPLRGQRDVMVEDRRPIQLLTGGGIILAVAALGFVVRAILRRRRRRAAQPAPVVEIVRPPDEVALERLRAIRERGQFSVENYQPFHFEVAEVVRAYLGARFGFDSLELTTTELLDELQRVTARPAAPGAANAQDAPNAPPEPPRPLLERALLVEIGAFLETCDLVKFAKAPSSDVAARHLLDDAERIVAATTTAAAAPAQPAPEAAQVING
jgi:hypothetical protein